MIDSYWSVEQGKPCKPYGRYWYVENVLLFQSSLFDSISKKDDVWNSQCKKLSVALEPLDEKVSTFNTRRIQLSCVHSVWANIHLEFNFCSACPWKKKHVWNLFKSHTFFLCSLLLLKSMSFTAKHVQYSGNCHELGKGLLWGYRENKETGKQGVLLVYKEDRVI